MGLLVNTNEDGNNTDIVLDDQFDAVDEYNEVNQLGPYQADEDIDLKADTNLRAAQLSGVAPEVFSEAVNTSRELQLPSDYVMSLDRKDWTIPAKVEAMDLSPVFKRFLAENPEFAALVVNDVRGTNKLFEIIDNVSYGNSVGRFPLSKYDKMPATIGPEEAAVIKEKEEQFKNKTGMDAGDFVDDDTRLSEEGKRYLLWKLNQSMQEQNALVSLLQYDYQGTKWQDLSDEEIRADIEATKEAYGLDIDVASINIDRLRKAGAYEAWDPWMAANFLGAVDIVRAIRAPSGEELSKINETSSVEDQIKLAEYLRKQSIVVRGTTFNADILNAVTASLPFVLEMGATNLAGGAIRALATTGTKGLAKAAVRNSVYGAAENILKAGGFRGGWIAGAKALGTTAGWSALGKASARLTVAELARLPWYTAKAAAQAYEEANQGPVYFFNEHGGVSTRVPDDKIDEIATYFGQKLVGQFVENMSEASGLFLPGLPFGKLLKRGAKNAMVRRFLTDISGDTVKRNTVLRFIKNEIPFNGLFEEIAEEYVGNAMNRAATIMGQVPGFEWLDQDQKAVFNGVREFNQIALSTLIQSTLMAVFVRGIPAGIAAKRTLRGIDSHRELVKRLQERPLTKLSPAYQRDMMNAVTGDTYATVDPEIVRTLYQEDPDNKEIVEQMGVSEDTLSYCEKNGVPVKINMGSIAVTQAQNPKSLAVGEKIMSQAVLPSGMTVKEAKELDLSDKAQIAYADHMETVKAAGELSQAMTKAGITGEEHTFIFDLITKFASVIGAHSEKKAQEFIRVLFTSLDPNDPQSKELWKENTARFIHDEYTKLRKEDAANKRNKKRSDEERAAKAEYRRVLREYNAAVAENAQREKNIATLNTTIAELKQDLESAKSGTPEQLEALRKKYEERNAQKNQRIKEANTELRNTKAELSKVQKELKDKKKELAQVLRDAAEAEQEMESLQKQLDEASVEEAPVEEAPVTFDEETKALIAIAREKGIRGFDVDDAKLDADQLDRLREYWNAAKKDGVTLDKFTLNAGMVSGLARIAVNKARQEAEAKQAEEQAKQAEHDKHVSDVRREAGKKGNEARAKRREFVDSIRGQVNSVNQKYSDLEDRTDSLLEDISAAEDKEIALNNARLRITAGISLLSSIGINLSKTDKNALVNALAESLGLAEKQLQDIAPKQKEVKEVPKSKGELEQEQKEEDKKAAAEEANVYLQGTEADGTARFTDNEFLWLDNLSRNTANDVGSFFGEGKSKKTESVDAFEGEENFEDSPMEESDAEETSKPVDDEYTTVSLTGRIADLVQPIIYDELLISAAKLWKEGRRGVALQKALFAIAKNAGTSAARIVKKQVTSEAFSMDETVEGDEGDSTTRANTVEDTKPASRGMSEKAYDDRQKLNAGIRESLIGEVEQLFPGDDLQSKIKQMVAVEYINRMLARNTNISEIAGIVNDEFGLTGDAALTADSVHSYVNTVNAALSRSELPFNLFRESRRAARRAARGLEQRDRKVRRGFTQFFADTYQGAITLIKGAKNFSTATHEFAHYGYLFLKQLVADGLADEYLIKQYNAITEWMNSGWENALKDYQTYIEHFEPDSMAPTYLSYPEWLQVQKEEKMARGFERYVMEGKAPSRKLQAGFSFMSRAMVRIYSHVDALGVNLSDKVRRAFDNLIVDQSAVDDGSAFADFLKLLDDHFAGLSAGGQGKEVIELINSAKAQAEAEITKERNAAIAEQKPYWRAEAEAIVSKDPVLLAWLSVLKDGTMSYKDVKEIVGKELADTLYNLGLVKHSKGQHPATVAEAINKIYPGSFPSVENLLQRLSKSESPSDFVDRYMSEQEDAFNREFDRTEPALRAERLIESLEKMEAELRKKVGKGLIDVRMSTATELALKVEDKLERGGFNEKTGNPYTVGQIISDKAFVSLCSQLLGKLTKAYNKKDYITAVKTLSTLREHLEYLRYKGRIVKRVADLKTLVKRAQRTKKGHIDGTYQEALFDLARRFGLSTRQDASAGGGTVESAYDLYKDGSATIESAIERYNKERREAGLDEFVLPEWLTAWENSRIVWGQRNNRPSRKVKDYKDLTGKQLQEVLNIAQFLYGMGKTIVSESEANRFKQFSDHLEADLDYMKPLNHKFKKPRGAIKRLTEHAIVAGKKLRDLVFAAAKDDPNNALIKTIYDPMMKMQGELYQIMNEPMTKIRGARNALIKSLRGKDLSSLNDIHFPGMVEASGYTQWTPSMVIACCLNMGTMRNRARLVDGYEWEGTNDTASRIGNETLAKVASILTAEDWDNIQAIWDAINSDGLAGASARAFREDNHFDREVEPASPFEVTVTDANGAQVVKEIRGGYYPLSYLYHTNEMREQKDDDKKSYTPPEHREASFNHRRNDGVKDPINLSLSVMDTHVFSVAHYISHRIGMKEVMRIIRNPRFREEFSRTQGFTRYEALLALSEAVATPDPSMGIQTEYLERMGRAIVAATALWSNAQVLAMQLTSFTIGAEELGGYLLDAHMKRLSNWSEMTDFVIGNSLFMKDRVKLGSDVLKRLNGDADINKILSFFTHASSYGFSPMQWFDSIVTIPAWKAAYDKAVAENHTHKEAVTIADEFVAKTQGGNRAIDLSYIETRKLGKAITMFYSAVSAQGNKIGETVRRIVNGKYGASEAIPAVISNLLVPVALQALIRYAFSPDDEKDPDRAQKAVIREVVTSMAVGFPVLRDILDMGFRKFQGVSATGGAVQAVAVRGATEMADTLLTMSTALCSGDFDWAAYNAAKLASNAAKVPVLNAYERLQKSALKWDWVESLIGEAPDPKKSLKDKPSKKRKGK